MVTEPKNGTTYKYVLGAVIFLFSVYVSYVQGTSQSIAQVDNKVQYAIASHESTSNKHDAEVEKRLERIEVKLDRLQEQLALK